jgi:glycosyltransferase involved in cell wall biosynthesis
MAAVDVRVVLLRHRQNKGLGGARNTGILHASADYVAGVDGDDYVDPQMFESLFEAAENGTYDIVACGFDRVDGLGNTLSKERMRPRVVDLTDARPNILGLTNPMFCNKIWRRSLFMDNDIFFPERLLFEDNATTPRLLAKAKNIRFIAGEYYKYVVRPDSLLSGVSDKHLLDVLRVLHILKRFLISEGIYDDQRRRFSRMAAMMTFHRAQTVLGSNLSADEKSHQLRLLLFLKEAFASLDDLVGNLPDSELIQLIEQPRGIDWPARGGAVRIPPPSPVIRRLKKIFGRPLARLGVRI